MSAATNSSIVKRKQACKNCRQRKKRCDGDRPICSLCRKWNTPCEYAAPASSKGSTQPDSSISPNPFDAMPATFLATEALPLDLGQSNPNNFFGQPETNTGFWSVFKSRSESAFLRNPFGRPLQYQMPWDASPPGTRNADSSIPIDPTLDQTTTHGGDMILSDISAPAALPSRSTMLELSEIFFLHYFHMLPCFHKTNLMECIKDESLQSEAPVLLYAIAAITAKSHPDPNIQNSQQDWYNQARLLYELTERDSQPAIRILQAAICLIFLSWTCGQYSTAWLHLGKAWRQTCSLGLHRLDSEPSDGFLLAPLPKLAREKEEYRRILWMLFIFDRSQSWPTGWPHAIDDRQFKIHTPFDNFSFQQMDDYASDRTISAPTSRHLDKFVSMLNVAAEPLNLFHYVIVGHIFLGRVTEHIHTLQDSSDSEAHFQEFDELDSQLVKYRLSIPRSALSVTAASSSDRSHVIWLNAILSTTTMLLYHRTTKSSPRTAPPEEEDENSDFARALASARNIIQMVKDASLICVDELVNAHIPSSYFLASTLFLIEYHRTKDEKLKTEMEIIELVLERYTEEYPVLARKFKAGIHYNRSRDEPGVKALMEAGIRGVVADCSRWKTLLGLPSCG